MIRSGVEMLAAAILLVVLGAAFILLGIAWALYNLPTMVAQWKTR